ATVADARAVEDVYAHRGEVRVIEEAVEAAAVGAERAFEVAERDGLVAVRGDDGVAVVVRREHADHREAHAARERAGVGGALVDVALAVEGERVVGAGVDLGGAAASE